MFLSLEVLILVLINTGVFEKTRKEDVQGIWTAIDQNEMLIFVEQYGKYTFFNILSQSLKDIIL